jgi:hypothetical protein
MDKIVKKNKKKNKNFHICSNKKIKKINIKENNNTKVKPEEKEIDKQEKKVINRTKVVPYKTQDERHKEDIYENGSKASDLMNGKSNRNLQLSSKKLDFGKKESDNNLSQFNAVIYKAKKKTKEKKYNDYEINELDEKESSDHSSSEFENNNFLSEKNKEIKEMQQKIITKETSNILPKYTIYETAIYNLKRIFHFMELNNLLEGEAGFDKLCVLSTNIIDFLIEYIDTLGDLTNIIDDNFKDLFFGTEKCDKITNLHNINNIGILPIFTMRIKENYEYYNEESFNKYELRKTMLAYMKLKYFQLLKAYLQIGNKSEFVKLLLAGHLGPLQLYEEILYYMKELINNLVHKDYDKYNHLLNIDSATLYRNKLNELYMYEDEFRTSVEISVVFQISLVIETLQETYRITMLKDHFEKDIPQEKFDYLADIQLDNEINYFNNIERENSNMKNINKNIINNNFF